MIKVVRKRSGIKKLCTFLPILFEIRAEQILLFKEYNFVLKMYTFVLHWCFLMCGVVGESVVAV